jgi:hypothetical protein
MRDCVGLSVGATNLVAARADGGATVRPAAVTWLGTVLTGFVERFGDPVPIVADDGSAHPADRLVLEALTDLSRSRGPAGATSVTVPAHWRAPLVDRMRALLPHAMVTSDAVAALTALRTYPGLPARGVVALCDFGATGTTITLADAGADFRTIGEVLRYDDFSGDLVDRALLTHLLAGLDVDPSSTSAVASLVSFRGSVRNAKERLSFQTAVGLRGPRPGTTLRLTRAEVETLVREPLDGVLAALDDTLRRNGIWHADLAAVATVGGGARMPLVTQRLSEALRMPVTTTAHAQTVAAIGAALLGGREPETATRLAAASKIAVMPAALPQVAQPAVASLAWSEFADEVDSEGDSFDDTGFARPEVVFDHAIQEVEELAPLRWYQRPALLFAAAACAAVVAAVGLFVTTDTKSANAASPMPTVSATPTMSDAQVPAAAAGSGAVAPEVVTETVIAGGRPNVRYTQAPAPKAPAPQAPAPADPPPAPVTTTPTAETTPTTTETTTSTPTSTSTSTPTSTTTSTSTTTPTSTSISTSTSTSTAPPPVELPPLPPLELPTLLPVEPPSASH